MSQKISDIANNLGLSPKELKEKINELGFEVKSTARTIEDDIAELITEELAPKEVSAEELKGDEAKIYEEI